MKKDMVAAAAENARKMYVIQQELRASNTKTDAILEMLSTMQSFSAPRNMRTPSQDTPPSSPRQAIPCMSFPPTSSTPNIGGNSAP